MEREINYNGHKYWVKIEPTIHEVTGETVYIAYVNNQKPGGILYGESVKDQNGNVLLFPNELSALTNANAIKQSEIDSNII